MLACPNCNRDVASDAQACACGAVFGDEGWRPGPRVEQVRVRHPVLATVAAVLRFLGMLVLIPTAALLVVILVFGGDGIFANFIVGSVLILLILGAFLYGIGRLLR